MIDTILLAVACICFLLAALGINAGRVNLIAAGLLAWALSALLPALVK